MEENVKKNINMCVYMCVSELLCCTPKTSTILYINYNSIKIKTTEQRLV